MTSCAKTFIFAFFIISIVKNVESSPQNEETWSQIFETVKNTYQLQSSSLGFMAPETRATLKELVDFYETAISKAIADKKESLFQMVKEQLKDPPLTEGDIEDMVKAYEAAHNMLIPKADEVFLAYMKYLTLAKGKYVDKYGTVWDRTSEGPAVPLKFDKDVYGLFFIIQRVLLTMGHPWSVDYESYKQRLMIEARPTGAPDGGDPVEYIKQITNQINDMAEDIGRNNARVKREDGILRAEDILKRTEMDLGQNSERTIAVAQIIASLYNHVGMITEAMEIQKRFNLDPKLTQQKLFDWRTEL